MNVKEPNLGGSGRTFRDIGDCFFVHSDTVIGNVYVVKRIVIEDGYGYLSVFFTACETVLNGILHQRLYGKRRNVKVRHVFGKIHFEGNSGIFGSLNINICFGKLDFVTYGNNTLQLLEGEGDLRAFIGAMNAALSGRGGGRDGLAQGSVAAKREEIEAYFTALRFAQID